MKLTTGPASILTALVVGGVIGYVGGPAFALIWWALIGLIFGALCSSNKAAIVNGSVYGFALSYAFMLASYNGQASRMTKLLPFVVFGIFGALCGAVLAIIGSYVARRFHRND